MTSEFTIRQAAGYCGSGLGQPSPCKARAYTIGVRSPVRRPCQGLQHGGLLVSSMTKQITSGSRLQELAVHDAVTRTQNAPLLKRFRQLCATELGGQG